MLYFTQSCLRQSIRKFSTFSSLFQQKFLPKDVLKDGSRILRVVQRRIDERAEIQSKLSDAMASPEDIDRLRQLKESEPLQEAWDHWTSTLKAYEDMETLLSDPDPAMKALASEEAAELDQKLLTILKSTFPSLLIPHSTTANLSALVELKSGVGGTESSLFLETLLRMYMRFSQSNSWKPTVVANNENEGGGIKDAIVEIKGTGAYDTLRRESGVHRVQRVPATESGGRVHTSTVTIIVLPLVEEQDAQKESLYTMDEIKLEVMRARGAGGQHVNKTESAVRITHIPTGITVSMQDERSQHQNKRRAFQVLSARLMDRKITREIAERRAKKNSLIKSADRSEKIRTYNYAQERVTDHRIGLSIMNLSAVIEGNALQDFTDALKQDFEETTMEEMLESEL